MHRPIFRPQEPQALVNFSIAGIAHAIRYFMEASDRDVQLARLSEQLSTARFSALQAQLNPHFLFNTLNTIAARARDGDGAGTARMVEQDREHARAHAGGRVPDTSVRELMRSRTGVTPAVLARGERIPVSRRRRAGFAAALRGRRP